MTDPTDSPPTGPPPLPHARFGLPWDDADAPPPVEAFVQARRELGDTFTLDSGDDHYLFLFSPEGMRSFYALAERDASKGLADYRMLLRKLPPELFEGRRTFAHDLFGAQEVETYLDGLDVALRAELDELGDAGTFDAFGLARRIGHRLGLACWIGPEVATGPQFATVMAELDQLDGAAAFVHPETVSAVLAGDYVAERTALARVETVVAAVLASRPAGTTGGADDFLSRIAARWSDVDEPARSQGIARDVVLLHVATMTNLVAALGWAIVRVLLDDDALASVIAEDRPAIDACTLEAIRVGQRSIMMRTALRPVEVDDGEATHQVDRGTIIATMVPVTNPDPTTPPELVTTFGHGSHRCPARRFSMTAIARTLVQLCSTFALDPEFDATPESLAHQIGGVGRAATPCPVSYRRLSR